MASTRARRLRSAVAALGLLAALVVTAPLDAQDVRIVLESQTTYGTPVGLQVVVADTETPSASTPTLPEVDGLQIEGPLGAPSERSSTSVRIVNGQRTVERSTTSTYTYRVRPQPGRLGRFRIGPARVEFAGGRALESETLELIVAKRPPSDLELTAKLSAESGPVRGPFRVVYTLAYPVVPGVRVHEDIVREGLRSLDFPILADSRLKVRSVEAEPGERHLTVRHPQYGELTYRPHTVTRDDGTALRAASFAFEAWPLEVGEYEVGGASAVMERPTGRYRRVRRLVFEETVPETRELTATVESTVFEAYTLPLAGQPQGFTGAIGTFRISASTQDTRVKQHDPIEVEIRVEGEGLLEDLPAPDWAAMDALTAQFEVASDARAGQSTERVRVFRQILRPRSTDVKAIPPIPFPYFDPRTKRYEQAFSEPIPIEVLASRTVTEFIPSRQSTTEGAQEGRESVAETPELVREEGVRENGREIGPVVASLDLHGRAFGPLVLATIAVPPALFGLLLLALRLRRRDPRALRSQRALKSARQALDAAEGNLEAVSGAYQEYFRARLGLPAGELTPPQLRAALARGGVDASTGGRATDCLERLLAGRFGGGADPRLLAAESRTILEEVDRCLS